MHLASNIAIGKVYLLCSLGYVVLHKIQRLLLLIIIQVLFCWPSCYFSYIFFYFYNNDVKINSLLCIVLWSYARISFRWSFYQIVYTTYLWILPNCPQKDYTNNTRKCLISHTHAKWECYHILANLINKKNNISMVVLLCKVVLSQAAWVRIPLRCSKAVCC